jgi:macrolide transport system ATP-binding/permease protein
MSAPVPPLYRWLLRVSAPAAEREWLLSDLDEEAAARAEAHGTREARAWSRRQVLASIRPLLGRRIEAAARTAWRAPMSIWRGVGADLLLAFRRLWAAPGFALICLLTLALGIGGNTAVFTLIDRFVFAPLPVPRPSELYRIGDTDQCCVNSGLPGSFSLFSYDLYLHLRDAGPQFSELAAFQATTHAITVGSPQPEAPADTLSGAFVSGNYFQMLDISPAIGRLMQPADDQASAAPVAVISHRAWTQHFHQRPDVVGSVVLLNGVAATVIGVTPKEFFGETLRPDPADIWIPLSNEPRLQPVARLLTTKSSHWLYIMGRLKPGTSPAEVQAQLSVRLRQWIAATLELSPEERERVPLQHVNVIAAAGGVASMRDEVRPSLQLLQAVAAAVLLIACANIANLLLARGMSRRTETAVRSALGATRGRLVAQFLSESLLLAFAGGLAGLVVAYAGARAIIDLTFRGAANVPVDPSPSPAVVVFAMAISGLTAVVFGAAPALVGSRSNPVDAMRGAGRSTADRSSKLRQSLIALQVALSLVLIMCAGLLGRSLDNLQKQDFGFQAEGLYSASLAPSLATTPPDQLRAIYAGARERLMRIPGIANVSFALYSPMSGDNWASRISVDGHGTSEQLDASWNRISPGYFDTVRTALLRGRSFDERDGPDGPLVAVISKTFADRFFGAGDPIGRRFGFTSATGASAHEFEIIGVVADAKYQDGWRPPYATFFLPFLQQSSGSRVGPAGSRYDRSHFAQALLVRTERGVPDLERALRVALGEVDARLIVRTFLPMQEQIAGNFNLERLISRLTIAFGSVALLLACLGIYGVTAYSVTRRTREIGIRMAIGASRPRVLGTILRGAFVQLAVGVAVGLPAAFIVGRLLQSTLFGVSGRDPLVLAAGLAILVVATATAALVPARRAATMNPVRALRVE